MKDYIQANQSAYDLVAEEYLARAGNSTEPLDNLAGTPLRLAGDSFENITALEIGPGSGEICAYFAQHNCDTTAIDVSEKILDNVRITSPSTKLVQTDILSHALPLSSYELIYCGALIHLFTIDDAKIVMHNIVSALKPGGVLFINTTIHPESNEGYYVKHDYNQNVKRYRHQYTRSEFTDLVESAGLAIVDTLTTDENERGKYWLAFICQKPAP